MQSGREFVDEVLRPGVDRPDLTGSPLEPVLVTSTVAHSAAARNGEPGHHRHRSRLAGRRPNAAIARPRRGRDQDRLGRFAGRPHAVAAGELARPDLEVRHRSRRTPPGPARRAVAPDAPPPFPRQPVLGPPGGTRPPPIRTGDIVRLTTRNTVFRWRPSCRRVATTAVFVAGILVVSSPPAGANPSCCPGGQTVSLAQTPAPSRRRSGRGR